MVRPVHRLELQQGLELDTMALELEQAHHRKALGQALHKMGLELALGRSWEQVLMLQAMHCRQPASISFYAQFPALESSPSYLRTFH